MIPTKINDANIFCHFVSIIYCLELAFQECYMEYNLYIKLLTKKKGSVFKMKIDKVLNQVLICMTFTFTLLVIEEEDMFFKPLSVPLFFSSETYRWALRPISSVCKA